MPALPSARSTLSINCLKGYLQDRTRSVPFWFIILPKTYTFWFMDQAHEPKWRNLGKCGLEGTKGISSRVPSKGSKIDTWLGVTQSALGSFDSSNSKTKIFSLIHVLIPFVEDNQHLILSQNSNCHYPK